MSKFRILWIDDQPKKCEREVEAVKSLIEYFGFEPDIDVEKNISKESLENPDGVLYKKIRARNVDLFLIDYNLKNNVFGSDIVREIRDTNDIYTDIVFYSSLNGPFLDAVRGSFSASSIMDYFDGVYIAPLGDEFTEKVQYVINKIIKSWYNVHSIRGVVLSKASKFEQVVGEIILRNYQSLLPEIKTALMTKGDNVRKNVQGKWNSVDGTDDPVPQILSDPINFNWTVKKVILQTLIDGGSVSLATFGDIKKIFELRNDFAHNPIHLVDGELVLLKKGEEKKFTEADIESIRTQLMRIENDLQNCYITVQQGQGTDKELVGAK